MINALVGNALGVLYPVTVVLFWIFAAGVVVLPPRWALLCLLLSANINVVPPEFVTAANVGWENAIQTVVLPVILLLRMTHFRIPRIRWKFPARAWAMLTCYAALSIIWSPFKLPGLKMVAYLGAWFILYIVFYLAWRRQILDLSLVVVALWGSLGLACFQTYVLGDPEQTITHQLTSFTSAESFAIFLTSILALLLFQASHSRLRVMSIGACLLSIVLAGDRTALIGMGCLFLVWFWYRRDATASSGLALVRAIPALLLCVILFFAFRATMAWALPESRLNELLQAGSGQRVNVQDIGTFGFRLQMYANTLSAVSQRSPLSLFLGSGTSSGGDLSVSSQQDFLMGVDPNRTIHDEFLRALYEWGLFGFGLSLALLFRFISCAWDLAFRRKLRPGYAVLAIIPSMLSVLLAGNPLSSPTETLGVGLVLVLTYGFAVGGPITPRGIMPTRLQPV